MLVVAKVSFSGRISMHCGEMREVPQGEVLQDLLAAGYIVPVDGQPIKPPAPPPAPPPKASQKAAPKER